MVINFGQRRKNQKKKTEINFPRKNSFKLKTIEKKVLISSMK